MLVKRAGSEDEALTALGEEAEVRRELELQLQRTRRLKLLLEGPKLEKTEPIESLPLPPASSASAVPFGSLS